MRIDQVARLLRRIAEKRVHVPIMEIGPTGVGKSWIVKDLARDLGIGCVDLRLAQQEPGDLIGLPRRDGDRTIWTLPEWWPADPGSAGVLFLDEINRAPLDVRQAVFQLVADWRLHTHDLPAGWVIFAATNPNVGDYQVEPLDPAMLRRFCQVRALPSVRDWLKWARRSAIDPRVVSFIEADARMLAVPEEFHIEARPSPEGYRLVHELLRADAVPPGLELEVFAGLIGMEAAAALVDHMARGARSFVSAADILNRYGEVRADLLRQGNDAMSASLDDLVDVAAPKGPGRLSDDQIKNFVACLKDLADEWKMTVLAGLKENPDLLERLSADPELCRDATRMRDEVDQLATAGRAAQKRTR